MSDLEYNKYLKYKMKYLELKQNGGGWWSKKKVPEKKDVPKNNEVPKNKEESNYYPEPNSCFVYWFFVNFEEFKQNNNSSDFKQNNNPSGFKDVINKYLNLNSTPTEKFKKIIDLIDGNAYFITESEIKYSLSIVMKNKSLIVDNLYSHNQKKKTIKLNKDTVEGTEVFSSINKEHFQYYKTILSDYKINNIILFSIDLKNDSIILKDFFNNEQFEKLIK
jgi:hypothetical protein